MIIGIGTYTNVRIYIHTYIHMYIMYLYYVMSIRTRNKYIYNKRV